MSELSIEDFTRYTVRILQPLGNIVLSNPDSEETFPLAVVSNPMQSVRKVEEQMPIYSRFSITVDWWADSKYKSMNLFQDANKVLRSYNYTLIGTPIDVYDEITKKHRYGGRYEVNYNGLTNSFERII